MAFMFENLQVYQKAVDLADRVAGLTEKVLQWCDIHRDELILPSVRSPVEE